MKFARKLTKFGQKNDENVSETGSEIDSKWSILWSILGEGVSGGFRGGETGVPGGGGAGGRSGGETGVPGGFLGEAWNCRMCTPSPCRLAVSDPKFKPRFSWFPFRKLRKGGISPIPENSTLTGILDLPYPGIH